VSDVLTLTIPLGARYPSRNHEGKDNQRFGRKSDEYRDLTQAVIEAARAEMMRTGWVQAECECLTIITRYMPNHLRADSLNIGSAECNALTAAGVWSDDRLAQPCTMHIRYDDEGPHRVTIVVMKLYEPANVRIVAKPKRDKLTKPAESTDSQKRIASPGKYVLSRTPQREKYTGGELPADKALVDGYLVDREEAMAEIKSLLGKRRAS
jgi:Holliday junction resolvase RusA-like endonuclease